MTMIKCEIRRAYIDDFSDWQFDYFVTLHANRSLSEKAFRKLMKEFMQRLNNRVYGRRSKKKLNCFAVAERSPDDLVHGHFLLGGPLGRLNEIRFKLIVKQAWAEQRLAADPLGRKVYSPDWFKPIWDARELLGYVTKTFAGHEDVIALDVCNKRWPTT